MGKWSEKEKVVKQTGKLREKKETEKIFKTTTLQNKNERYRRN
jgi:hypothetical protein